MCVLPFAREENQYLECQHVEHFLCVCFLWQGKRTSTLIVNMLNIFVCALPLAREENWYFDCLHVEHILCECFLWQGKIIVTLL